MKINPSTLTLVLAALGMFVLPAVGASVDITVNGTVQWQGLTGVGEVQWTTPSTPGTYTLQHAVKNTGGVVITNLTALFRVLAVIAEPTAVPHATAVVTYDNGDPVATNNQGQIVAPVGALMKVTYKAEKEYYFQNGADSWSAGFRVDATATTPPKPEIEPRQLVEVDYVDEKGTASRTKALVLSSTSQTLTLGKLNVSFFVITNDVVMTSGISFLYSNGRPQLILSDGATLQVRGVEGFAGIYSNVSKPDAARVYGQRLGTGKLSICGGRNAPGLAARLLFAGGTGVISGSEGFPALADTVENMNSSLTVRADNDRHSQTILGQAGWYTAKTVAGMRYLTIAPEVPTVTVPVEHASRKIYVDGVEAVQGMVWSNQTATVVYTADEGYMFASGDMEMTFELDATKSPAEIVDWQDPGALVKAWEETRTLTVDTRERIIVNTPDQVLPIACSPDLWGETNLFPSVKMWVTHEGGVEFAADVEKDGTFAWQPESGAFGRYVAGLFNADKDGDPQDILRMGAIYYGADYQLINDSYSNIEVRFSESDEVPLENPTNVTSYTVLNLKATPEFNNFDRYEFARWWVIAYPEADYWLDGEVCSELEANFGDLTAQETTFEMPFTNVILTCEYQWMFNYKDPVFVGPGDENEWTIYEGETYQQGIETEAGSIVILRSPVDIGSELHLAGGATVLWNFEDDDRPSFANYDGCFVAESCAVRLVKYDSSLTNGVYMMATKANTSVGQEFVFEGPGDVTFTVTVGGDWMMVGEKRYKLSVDEDGNLLLMVDWGTIPFAFEQTEYEVVEGGAIIVRAFGGSVLNSAQTTLTSVKNTGSYSEVRMNGARVSLPLTLCWEKGDVEPKEILFKTSASPFAAADKTFTLQLGADVGDDRPAARTSCTVTILDAQGGAAAKPYVRALAWPANAGSVSGSGELMSKMSYRTLSATAKSYATFAGWYRASEDDQNVIDLGAPVEPYDPRYPRRIRIGYDSAQKKVVNEAGTYFAYFTNVLEVAAVLEPMAFDPKTGKPLEGVAGIAAHDAENGTYETFVGVKFALPVGFADASGKGKLKVTKLPSGLSYRSKESRIVGVPTKAGAFTVRFVASNAAGRHTVEYVFAVRELPTSAVGAFNGVVYDSDGRAGVGSVQFAAGKTGSLSAKVTRRLAGARSFSGKGYDYVDEGLFGVAMTNCYGEVFEAMLPLTNGPYATALCGRAFGGSPKKATLAKFGETNGVFSAVRNALKTSEKNVAALQTLELCRGTYKTKLFDASAEEEIGAVEYRVKAEGNVYLAARLAKSVSAGGKTVAAKTLCGTAAGALRVDPAQNKGWCEAALRCGTSVWSTYGMFDATYRAFHGAARFIRADSDDKTKVLDEDQCVGE